MLDFPAFYRNFAHILILIYLDDSSFVRRIIRSVSAHYTKTAGRHFFARQQYFDAGRNLLVSENATEPRLLNNGECYTFFDWDKSEKLKSKGILATDLTDLTNKARYISFGGRQQRLQLVVSNKGYGIATASSRTALFCNIKMYGQYIFADGDTQSDYYFIGAGSVGHTLELYSTL